MKRTRTKKFKVRMFYHLQNLFWGVFVWEAFSLGGFCRGFMSGFFLSCHRRTVCPTSTESGVRRLSWYPSSVRTPNPESNCILTGQHQITHQQTMWCPTSNCVLTSEFFIVYKGLKLLFLFLILLFFRLKPFP